MFLIKLTLRFAYSRIHFEFHGKRDFGQKGFQGSVFNSLIRMLSNKTLPCLPEWICRAKKPFKYSLFFQWAAGTPFTQVFTTLSLASMVMRFHSPFLRAARISSCSFSHIGYQNPPQLCPKMPPDQPRPLSSSSLAA